MTARTRTTTDQRIAEQAAQWLLDLEDGEIDKVQFAAWLQASPRHIEEFLLVSAVWRAADGLDREHHIDIDQLIAQARDNVRRLDEESIPRRRAHDVGQRMGSALRSRVAASIAVLALICATWIGLQDASVRYATDTGEQRIVKLPDGSIVTLNTRSQIKVRIDDEQRIVELSQGEALFDVAHDAQRPFRVFAGPAVARAVGTQFNVYRKEDGTTIGVVEGIVEVTSRGGLDDSRAEGATPPAQQLAVGEQASFSSQGAVERANVAIDRIVAWRERRLIFRGESLASIAAEFNRYNETQLRVDGPATRARLISGVFDADNPSGLVAFLERDQQLAVRKQGNYVVISGP